LHLPPDFTRNIVGAFGEAGRHWQEKLPGLITQATIRWGLSNLQPVPNLSYNYVAFAQRGDEEVVLKVGVPDRELSSEMAALECFDGIGACRLLEKDEKNFCFLLERLKPGELLSSLADDDKATRIAVQVMQTLWKPAPTSDKLIQLSDWLDGLKRIRAHDEGGMGPIPDKLLRHVESLLLQLFMEPNRVLIHGDLHHDNILLSERGWLAIDPKGVIGPAGYEIGPFMLNPLSEIPDEGRFRKRSERRIEILTEMLGFEREQIIQWSTVHAVLSAWWNVEDGLGWDYSMRCAEILSKIT
jgi:streptomycin 6-kinase